MWDKYQFKDQQLLLQAFTHRSFHNEQGAQTPSGHNERLEFLGDAVLDLGLSDLLMRQLASSPEGDLSKIRASLVNERVLSELALEYGIDQRLRLGRGEAQSGGAQKPRLLSSAFEAYVGALYLDGGFDMAMKFIEESFSSRLQKIDPYQSFSEDYKTRLQELAQQSFRQTPTYELKSEEGPAHDRLFSVVVSLQGQGLASGQGRSKKQAEQEAARKALEAWSPAWPKQDKHE